MPKYRACHEKKAAPANWAAWTTAFPMINEALGLEGPALRPGPDLDSAVSQRLEEMFWEGESYSAATTFYAAVQARSPRPFRFVAMAPITWLRNSS